MRTGKLSISRGHQWEGSEAKAVPRLTLVPHAPDSPAPPACPDYHLVHDRLTALERLARLQAQGALSAEEFAVEKAIVLGLPADELVLRAAGPVSFVPAEPRRPARGPSLLGRLLSWRLIPIGLAAGLGLSFASQPEPTLRAFDQALRLFGI